MKIRVVRMGGLVMALLGAVTIAEAHPGRDGGGPEGREKRPSREEILKRYDKDGDGQLSEAERQQLRQDHADRRGSGDGKGGPDRQRPRREEMLKRFDQNGDGELNEDERQAMHEARQERRSGSGGNRPGREEMMNKFDTDGDGELNEEERKSLREAMGKRRGRRGPGQQE